MQAKQLPQRTYSIERALLYTLSHLLDDTAPGMSPSLTPSGCRQDVNSQTEGPMTWRLRGYKVHISTAIIMQIIYRALYS